MCMEKGPGLWVGPWGPSGGPHGTHEGTPRPPMHNNWQLLNIVLQNLKEITRMLKGSDLSQTITLTLTDWSFVKIFLRRRHTRSVRVGALSHKVDLIIFFVYFKYWKASKLHYWFNNYGIFAWICWAESRDYSPHRHCRNHNLTLESPKISTGRPQAPDKLIGPLCRKCHRQKVLKKILQSTNSERNWHINIPILLCKV